MPEGSASVYDELFSMQNIKKIYRGEVSGRGTAGMDGLTSTRFHKQRQEHFEIIYRKCRNGSFTFTPYKQVLRSKGRNKTPRVISIPTVRDKIVLYILKERLHAIFDDCVNRKIPNQIIEEISEYINNVDDQKEVYRTDIKSFYGSIDHETLEGKLESRVKSEKFLNLIFRAIKTPTVPEDYIREKKNKYKRKEGIPQGLSISNILAEICLEGFDRYIDEMSNFYARYVDDMLVITDNNISEVKQSVKDELDERGGLEISCKKSYTTNIRKGFQFLGYVFDGDNVTVRRKSIDSFIDSLAGILTSFRENFSEMKRKKYNVDAEALKDILVENVNEMITGAISKDRRYGWVFYYMEVTDMELLHRIDSIVESFFERHPKFEKIPNNLKRIVRAYYEARNNPRGGYIKDYDQYDTLESKREYLDERGFLDPSEVYSSDRIEMMFEREKEKNISRLKADTGTLS